MNNPPKTVIFDLDGTLADSLPIIIEVVNELKIVDHTLTRDDYERLKNFHIKEILKDLGIPLWRAPRILIKGQAALTQRVAEIPLFPGMQDVLSHLKAQNHRLFVMSSNSLDNVERFLKVHDIEAPFDAVYGGVGIFGKPSNLRKIVKDHNLDKATTYYVGDEVRDVEAAKKAGVRSIAVTWGFNGDKILQEGKPDYLVRSPKELEGVFKG